MNVSDQCLNGFGHISIEKPPCTFCLQRLVRILVLTTEINVFLQLHDECCVLGTPREWSVPCLHVVKYKSKVRMTLWSSWLMGQPLPLFPHRCH